MKVQLPKESVYIVVYQEDYESPDILAVFNTQQSAENFIQKLQKNIHNAIQLNEDTQITLVDSNNKYIHRFDKYSNLNKIQLYTRFIAKSHDIPFFNK